MATNTASTINVKAYFPTGSWVTISLAFDSLETMPTADEIIAGVEAKGFAIEFEGVEAGDKIQTVTHVMRRTKVNKDGTTTPVIALYHENVGMKYKLDHVYLNNDDEIAEFETASGMKLTSIPEYEGEAFLPRDHAKAGKYIVQMPKPVKVATYEGEYEFNGKTDTKDYIRSFIGASKPTGTPDNVTDIPPRADNNGKSTKTEKAPWLSVKEETDKIKQQLEFFALDGDDLVAKARAKIDPKINSYYLPEDYLKAIENEINNLKVGA